ncbi:uncharacterized protein LOC129299523 [Prosopis cineraria]|uniref:uncharacterized protein LOC129299523 n=1 Tax=Prosopis cineraria TaxID=364024 RepID=UPI00240F515F|nr:uncharacterized protein LOC129299523 [Prosopis cineraria]
MTTYSYKTKPMSSVSPFTYARELSLAEGQMGLPAENQWSQQPKWDAMKMAVNSISKMAVMQVVATTMAVMVATTLTMMAITKEAATTTTIATTTSTNITTPVTMNTTTTTMTEATSVVTTTTVQYDLFSMIHYHHKLNSITSFSRCLEFEL